MTPQPLGRSLVTLGWLAALVAAVRWWELTLNFPGLLLWTCGFIVWFLAGACARFGRQVVREERRVWRPLRVWVGILIGVYAAHALVPTFRFHGMVAQSAAIVGVIDVVLPVWILAHGVGLWWEPVWQAAIVAAAIPLLLVLAWAYMIPMPGRPFGGTRPPLTAPEAELRDRLERHVQRLAGEIGERNYARRAALEAARRYVSGTLAESGYAVRTHEYAIGGERYRNVEASLPGATRPQEIVLVGGHYDSVEGAPGADDNASGVAAVLELARLFREERVARTVRFVAFVNEEPPFFNTPLMGSRMYAADAAAAGERIVAMLSIETIGYYSDEPGSQQYPFPFSFFYPDRGDFIGFVANLGSRALVRRSIAAFREAATVPAHGVASPAWIPGINWSDHASFWLHGYRAIMISDTAPFRYPHYHLPSDTPDKLDYERMARVVRGLAAVVRELARAGE